MNHLKDDKQVYEAIQEELNRQRNKLEMIASENIVSYAVMEAQAASLQTSTLKAIRARDTTAAANL